ncbi:MAG: hypothetical protein COC15_02505 [Legionellales bacterium]|nr:MAG: hypothetical protein COC15_02505 [Legionellales bacterium]
MVIIIITRCDKSRALLGSNPKANINATRQDGMTALILACQEGHTEVVQALLGSEPKKSNVI